jgi:sialate O-acetylesterase
MRHVGAYSSRPEPGPKDIFMAPDMAAPSQLQLPAIISDHMVVQQNKPLAVYGTDFAGQRVTVQFGDQSDATTADPSGRWKVMVKPPPAGGPYQLSISGSSQRTISDVLVGEVWLCSGQSNMQWSVSVTKNAQQEIAQAKWPMIRLFNVPNVNRRTPQDDVSAEWVSCSPQTVGGFSAVGYFFGRHLHQQLNVPIGLINSSWGGTAAEAWTPREELSTLPGMADALNDVGRDQGPAWQRFGQEISKFLGGYGIVNEGGEKLAVGWANVEFDDSAWARLAAPAFWQSVGLNGNGIVWFRKTVDIAAVAAGLPATLELGGVDDFDVSFVNGVEVGKTAGETPMFWSAPRSYAVPAGVLRPGRNVIAVRVVDFGGTGGFAGPGIAMKLTYAKAVEQDKPVLTSVPLAGEWRYALERPISIPGDAQRPNMPAGDIMMAELYNAMIHPFIQFPIAGVIWYQGETNAGQPQVYRKLLPTMIQAWRKRWGDDFTFLIVQLAGFGTDSGNPADSPGWAVFRDVQRQIAESDPKAGLALAIDIGDAVDIHPTNKQDVGKRLALQALKITYGKNVVASGPTVASTSAANGKVTLSFDNIGGGLAARDGSLAGDFALQDKSGAWAWADARIEGDKVIVSSPKASQPVMVRYAWQNTPPARLSSMEGLPAMPFEIPVK